MNRLVPLLLILAVACGGGGGGGGTPRPASPTRLVYTDPPAGGWRWVRNAATTDTLLVLDLQGPGPGSTGRGVAFSLTVGNAAVTWEKAAGTSSLVAPGQVLDLGSGVQLFKTQVVAVSLTAGLFQKGRGNAVPLDGRVCSVGLALGNPQSAPGSVPLTVPLFQVLPATGSTLVDTPCAVGTLALQ
jgi:hypothetical protein